MGYNVAMLKMVPVTRITGRDIEGRPVDITLPKVDGSKVSSITLGGRTRQERHFNITHFSEETRISWVPDGLFEIPYEKSIDVQLGRDAVCTSFLNLGGKLIVKRTLLSRTDEVNP